MKEFKGTPGPWNAQEHTVWGKDIGDRIALSAMKYENSVVTVEGLANAQLIAAAPELLEALQKIDRDIEANQLWEYVDHLGIRKVIAKALGE